MDLLLETPVFVREFIGLDSQNGDLALETPRLNVFPDADHEHGENNPADLEPRFHRLDLFGASHKCSNTRSLALRARGLDEVSSSCAVIGFFVRIFPHGDFPHMHCGNRGGQTQPRTAA